MLIVHVVPVPLLGVIVGPAIDCPVISVVTFHPKEPLPSQEVEDVRYYELYSIVSNILTSEGSNLVCTLKVGERYHQRKERVTCTQWYLINDFSITPVEKVSNA